MRTNLKRWSGELADLHAQVLAKQGEIEALKKRLGTFKEESVLKLVGGMLKARGRAKDAPSLTKKKRGGKLSASTVAGYKQLVKDTDKVAS